MNQRPLRPCVHPRCSVLVERGRCHTHERDHQRKRGSAVRRGYGTRHKRQRLLILARDPICRGCQRAPSTVDDHIVPIEASGSATDDQNQQGLCIGCHGFKTAVEQRDPFFGVRLREEGSKTGQPAPLGWRHLPAFGGAQ